MTDMHLIPEHNRPHRGSLPSFLTRAAVGAIVLLSLGTLVQGAQGDRSNGDLMAMGSVAPPHPFPPLEGAAASTDELIERLLEALAANDAKALQALRVTRSEYLDLIVPLTVEPGEAPRQVSDAPKEYLWQVLDFKSRLYEARLLELFGGRRWARRELRFSRPSRHYAGYDAYGEVRLALMDDDGETIELRSGWVAEVGGRFKFISLYGSG
jgi:hypothetical protein